MPDGTAKPQKLASPENDRSNNGKALSPDRTKIAFSATVSPSKGPEVFLADADRTNNKLMTQDVPSSVHRRFPDNKVLAFLAQHNRSGHYDIYEVPAAGGAEQRLSSNVHQDDGPDHSPDDARIYINSDRSGKQAVWRFPANGAGPNDSKALRAS
jgi:Tol biopolymer transport system component